MAWLTQIVSQFASAIYQGLAMISPAGISHKERKFHYKSNLSFQSIVHDLCIGSIIGSLIPSKTPRPRGIDFETPSCSRELSYEVMNSNKHQKTKEPPQSPSLHWYLCGSYPQEPIIDAQMPPRSIEGLNILSDPPLTTHKQKPSSKSNPYSPESSFIMTTV
jgi:hypothetical protein